MIEVENTLITGFDKPNELKEVKPLDLAVENSCAISLGVFQSIRFNVNLLHVRNDSSVERVSCYSH